MPSAPTLPSASASPHPAALSIQRGCQNGFRGLLEGVAIVREDRSTPTREQHRNSALATPLSPFQTPLGRAQPMSAVLGDMDSSLVRCLHQIAQQTCAKMGSTLIALGCLTSTVFCQGQKQAPPVRLAQAPIASSLSCGLEHQACTSASPLLGHHQDHGRRMPSIAWAYNTTRVSGGTPSSPG